MILLIHANLTKGKSDSYLYDIKKIEVEIVKTCKSNEMAKFPPTIKVKGQPS